MIICGANGALFGALGGAILILLAMFIPMLANEQFRLADIAAVMMYATPISGIYGAVCGAILGVLFALVLSLLAVRRQKAIGNALSSRIVLSLASGVLVLVVIESIIDRAVIWSSPLDFNSFSLQGAVIAILISYFAFPRVARKLF
jgi:hypothetical protein